ncbi:MAG: cyclic nucleotide-binding domain-containing protein [Alphaproteobacteria bacterium]|nr:cyclic nucleotide-binding domain-containing protein [Alphaproteobacteria bacterium]
MSLNEEVDVLRAIPLFSKIEPAKLKLLAFTSERITYESGQALFKQGDMGDAAYIIMDGEAAVLIDTAQGRIQVAKFKRGDIVGEIAILCDMPRTATVEAVGKLTTLRISKELFFRLVTEFPQMAIQIMRELAHRVERMNIQLREMVNKSRN